MYQSYIAGKLGLAGLDLSTPLPVWLDAVYTAWADAPHELLQQAMRRFVIHEARIDPERARADWGLRPEHQALNRGLGQEGGEHEKPIPRVRSGTSG